jgi:hypothetical protein
VDSLPRSRASSANEKPFSPPDEVFDDLPDDLPPPDDGASLSLSLCLTQCHQMICHRPLAMITSLPRMTISPLRTTSPLQMTSRLQMTLLPLTTSHPLQSLFPPPFPVRFDKTITSPLRACLGPSGADPSSSTFPTATQGSIRGSTAIEASSKVSKKESAGHQGRGPEGHARRCL